MRNQFWVIYSNGAISTLSFFKAHKESEGFFGEIIDAIYGTKDHAQILARSLF